MTKIKGILFHIQIWVLQPQYVERNLNEIERNISETLSGSKYILHKHKIHQLGSLANSAYSRPIADGLHAHPCRISDHCSILFYTAKISLYFLHFYSNFYELTDRT